MITLERKPSSKLALALFGGLTVLAIIGLVSLGNWQMRRLAYKTQLAADVTHKLKAPPLPLPPQSDWHALDPEAVDYTPMTVRGHFVTSTEFHVFTTLVEPKGRDGGVGWWIFSPFVTDDGATIIVNRGFVPDRLKDPATRASGQIQGELSVMGLLRRPEGQNPFTPANDLARNRWFTRDPIAMAATLGLSVAQTLPFYLDAGKEMTPPGGFPQAGETVIDFSNNHLGYALTWYGLALAASGVFLAFAWRWLRVPMRFF